MMAGHDAYLFPPLLQCLHPKGELAHRPHRRRLPTTLRLSLKIVFTMVNMVLFLIMLKMVMMLLRKFIKSDQMLSHSHPPLH